VQGRKREYGISEVGRVKRGDEILGLGVSEGVVSWQRGAWRVIGEEERRVG